MATWRVALVGLGAMGSGMARHLLHMDGVELVAAVSGEPDHEGLQLANLLGEGQGTGLRVTTNAEETLAAVRADVAILATTSFFSTQFPLLEAAVASGHNVISIAEEMAYPWASDPALAKRLDQLARQHGVSVLGTGINPGFVLDVLIILLTAPCLQVERITARRVNDLSPFGPTVMQTQGVGTTPEQFREGVAKGEIVGHIGFRQSMHMIAAALGWHLDEVVEERAPIITRTRRQTAYVDVMPGQVAGCRHIAYGKQNGQVKLTIEHPQQVRPDLEGVSTGDFIKIEGNPGLAFSSQPEIPGGTGTVALAVNMIPAVVAARPGLLCMTELPVPRAWGKD